MDEVKPLARDDTTETKEKIWDSTKEPLNEQEEDMDYDGSAYEMLHRSKVEGPCLSVDFLLRDRISADGPVNQKQWFPSQVNGNLDTTTAGATYVDRLDRRRHKHDKFPMSAYLVAGSQATKKNENKIYVMKWAEMFKTVDEDKECSDSDEEN